jgi:hypothetical protein
LDRANIRGFVLRRYDDADPGVAGPKSGPTERKVAGVVKFKLGSG